MDDGNGARVKEAVLIILIIIIVTKMQNMENGICDLIYF